MKNTTFRKKALLSSVAMLLVALVALGSATFAWFTTNPTVEANGLSLNATAAAGLQIVSNSEKTLGKDFGTATVINAETIGTTNDESITFEQPVSLDVTSGNFYTTLAALETEYNKADDAIIEPASAAYTEDLWLRSSVNNGETIEVTSAKVTITPASGDGAGSKLTPAIRVTLVDGADNSIIGTWSTDGVANKYLTATAVSTDAYTKAYKSDVAADMSKAVGYSGTDNVKVLVWLDGEDSECFTSNVEVLADLVSSIKVTFSTK